MNNNQYAKAIAEGFFKTMQSEIEGFEYASDTSIKKHSDSSFTMLIQTIYTDVDGLGFGITVGSPLSRIDIVQMDYYSIFKGEMKAIESLEELANAIKKASGMKIEDFDWDTPSEEDLKGINDTDQFK